MVERTAERLIEDGELPWHPSFFEMLTAMAFEHFATSKVDIAVLEVGMGGRLDATNVIEPRVSVITDIALGSSEIFSARRSRRLRGRRLELSGEAGSWSRCRRVRRRMM